MCVLYFVSGRAGKSGTAISFVTNDDSPLFFELKEMLQNSPVRLVLEKPSFFP